MKIEEFLKKSLIIPTIFAAADIQKELQQSLQQHGLSILEALVLVAIVFEGRDCRPSELAQDLQASRVRISQAIKGLIEKDLVDRKLERKDARFVAVKVTAKGKTLSVKLISQFDRINDNIEAKIGVKNAETTAAHLHRLLAP